MPGVWEYQLVYYIFVLPASCGASTGGELRKRGLYIQSPLLQTFLEAP